MLLISLVSTLVFFRGDAAASMLKRLSSSERSSLAQELVQWKQSAAGQDALAMGLDAFLPSFESTQAQELDQLERLYQSKQLIHSLAQAHPNAVFSLDSPFSLLTEQEFEAYVARGGLRSLQSSPPMHSKFFDDDDGDDLLDSVDWLPSGCIPPVKNQGRCGSCAYFSSTAALEASECIYNSWTNDMTLFSEQRSVSCFGGGCKGEWPHLIMEFVQQQGVCQADAYPYTSGSTSVNGECLKDKCQPLNLPIQQVVQVNTTETALARALVNRPVVVMVAAGNRAWKQYKSGILETCGDAQMDHAVLAVGYSSRNANGGSAWNIKNSWGTSWGENGYIRLRRGNTNDRFGTCRIVEFEPVYPEY